MRVVIEPRNRAFWYSLFAKIINAPYSNGAVLANLDGKQRAPVLSCPNDYVNNNLRHVVLLCGNSSGASRNILAQHL